MVTAGLRPGIPWLPGSALAWSDVGHRTICEIAFQELEPTARERVRTMIARSAEFDPFAESCSSGPIIPGGLPAPVSIARGKKATPVENLSR